MAPEKPSTTQSTSISPDGAFVATVQAGRLVIRSGTCLGLLHTFKLPSDSITRCRLIRWSRGSAQRDTTPHGQSAESAPTSHNAYRILLADDCNIRVYDTANPKWRATIRNAAGSLGKIDNATFGFFSDEVLVFSDFGVKMTIWSLSNSKGIEIRDPKYGVACFAFRKQTGHMALLTRGCAHDVLVILRPRSHAVLRRVELATFDAQEVLWSDDGNWIAVRDSASSGHRVLIYTADGHLYKTWCGENMSEIGQGVKTMHFVPGTGNLVVGDYNDKITILRTETFSTLGVLSHPHTIHHAKAAVWEEQIDATKARSYTEAKYPVSPSVSSALPKSDVSSRHGVSVLSLNVGETLLATKTEAMPTTIWIWSMQSGALVSVLIHHSPVKQVAWHPSNSDMLLIHCAISEPLIHIWDRQWEAPKILSSAVSRLTGKIEASWLLASSEGNSRIILTSPHQDVFFQMTNKDGETMPLDQMAEEPDAAALSMSTGPEDMFDEGNSLDLSPIKLSHSIGEGFGMTGASVDDTFHYRRRNVA